MRLFKWIFVLLKCINALWGWRGWRGPCALGRGVISGCTTSHFPPAPGQGAAPRLIVRPGWWTFGRMESEMECDIVESPSSIPRDPIARQRPNHPHTRAVRVQVPPLTWATVALAVGDSGVVVWLVSQRFQWNRAPLIAWYTDATDYLLPPRSIQQCAADPTWLQTLTPECCLTVFSFYQFMIIWHLNNGVYEHVLALRKLMLIYPDGLCVKKTKPWQFPRLRSTDGAFVARPPIAALYNHFLSLGCCLLSSPHS